MIICTFVLIDDQIVLIFPYNRSYSLRTSTEVNPCPACFALHLNAGTMMGVLRGSSHFVLWWPWWPALLSSVLPIDRKCWRLEKTWILFLLYRTYSVILVMNSSSVSHLVPPPRFPFSHTFSHWVNICVLIFQVQRWTYSSSSLWKYML